MIVQISGKVISIAENSITLQVNNLAYEILVPISVVNFYKKKSNPPTPSGSETPEETLDTFYTIQYIEGSSGHGNQWLRLVGFKRQIEKDFFQLYTSVDGVGYKTALKSLTLPIQKIAMAIESRDLAVLKKLPHIGSRTAEKMIATLTGRMKRFILDPAIEPLSVEAEPDFQMEVLQVLRQVGYHETEALNLIAKVLRKNAAIKTAEEMLQEIFSLQNSTVLSKN
jgi:Holliday junction DNA helicase RuvA